MSFVQSDAHTEPNNESDIIALDIASEAKKVGFFRWENVSKHPGPYTLHRSSSPNYDEDVGDSSQRVDDKGIAFLHKYKIGHVICLNSDELSSFKIGTELANAKPRIEFTRVPVKDFHSPTLVDMENGYQAYLAKKTATLVWCGYGHGRTGTMITALQYKIEKAKGKTVDFKDADYKANYVEQYHGGVSTGQYETLNKLQGKK